LPLQLRAQSSELRYFVHVTGTRTSARINPRDLPDHLLARGEYWVTAADIAETLSVSDVEARQIAGRWRARQQAFSPTRGAYVLIPPQYRTWGAVPASHFVDDLMRFLGHAYYVGYLSAAEVHDAAHQRPQVFQVVTDAHLRDREFDRVRMTFIRSTTTSIRPTVSVNTPTGTMKVSTPEVTILDMASAPEHSGGLSNIATVIADLLEDSKLDPAELARVAATYPVSVTQRTGWLIDLAAREIGADIDLDALTVVAAQRSKPTPLASGDDPHGPHDGRWNIIVNADVEPDL
jgi:predicted transcriptional regulator of viral defense system